MKFYKYTENIGEALGIAEQVSEIDMKRVINDKVTKANAAAKEAHAERAFTNKAAQIMTDTRNQLSSIKDGPQIRLAINQITAAANNRFIIEFMRQLGLFRMRVGLYYPSFKKVDGKETDEEIKDYYSDLLKKLEEKKNVPAETREINVGGVAYQLAKDEQLPDDFTGGDLNGTVTAEAFEAKLKEFNDACMKATTYANASSPDFIGDDVELKDFKKDTGILAYDVKTSRRFYEAEKVRLAEELKGMVH